MRISKLISKLQKAQDKHGDLPLYKIDTFYSFNTPREDVYCKRIISKKDEDSIRVNLMNV